MNFKLDAEWCDGCPFFRLGCNYYDLPTDGKRTDECKAELGDTIYVVGHVVVDNLKAKYDDGCALDLADFYRIIGADDE